MSLRRGIAGAILATVGLLGAPSLIDAQAPARLLGGGIPCLLRALQRRELVDQPERLPATQIRIQRVGSCPFPLHDEESARRTAALEGLEVDIALLERAPDDALGCAANDRRVGH